MFKTYYIGGSNMSWHYNHIIIQYNHFKLEVPHCTPHRVRTCTSRQIYSYYFRIHKTRHATNTRYVHDKHMYTIYRLLYTRCHNIYIYQYLFIFDFLANVCMSKSASLRVSFYTHHHVRSVCSRSCTRYIA